MPDFGPDLVGLARKVHRASYDVPPPGYYDEGGRSASQDARMKKAQAKWQRAQGASGASIAGFSVKRGLKKGFRGAKGGLKKAGRVAVKLHTMPLKLAAKVAKAIGKQAARPVRALFVKLAMRRAKALAWRSRGTTLPNTAEKAQGGAYALKKLKKAGPVGFLAIQILKHTWGTGVGGEDCACDSSGACACRGESTMGMTGAEIAAAVATVLGAMTALIKALNKPGEAPADPKSGSPAEAPAEAPADQPSETVTSEDMEAAGIFDPFE